MSSIQQTTTTHFPHAVVDHKVFRIADLLAIIFGYSLSPATPNPWALCKSRDSRRWTREDEEWTQLTTRQFETQARVLGMTGPALRHYFSHSLKSPSFRDLELLLSGIPDHLCRAMGDPSRRFQRTNLVHRFQHSPSPQNGVRPSAALALEWEQGGHPHVPSLRDCDEIGQLELDRILRLELGGGYEQAAPYCFQWFKKMPQLELLVLKHFCYALLALPANTRLKKLIVAEQRLLNDLLSVGAFVHAVASKTSALEELYCSRHPLHPWHSALLSPPFLQSLCTRCPDTAEFAVWPRLQTLCLEGYRIDFKELSLLVSAVLECRSARPELELSLFHRLLILKTPSSCIRRAARLLESVGVEGYVLPNGNPEGALFDEIECWTRGAEDERRGKKLPAPVGYFMRNNG